MIKIQHGRVGYQQQGVFPPSTERKRFSTLEILFKVEQKIISFLLPKTSAADNRNEKKNKKKNI